MYFHVQIPKRKNPYLAPLLEPQLVGIPGKRRKRSRNIDQHPTTCEVCKSCRLRVRDNADKKRATSTEITSVGQNATNKLHIQQYQAGADSKTAQVKDYPHHQVLSLPHHSLDSHSGTPSFHYLTTPLTLTQARPRRGTADHWCGENPSTHLRKLLGPHFMRILRKRIIKRPGRGHSPSYITLPR